MGSHRCVIPPQPLGEAEPLCFFLSLNLSFLQTESENCLEGLILLSVRLGKTRGVISLSDCEENQGCGLGCHSMAEHFYSIYEALDPALSIRKNAPSQRQQEPAMMQ